MKIDIPHKCDHCGRFQSYHNIKSTGGYNQVGTWYAERICRTCHEKRSKSPFVGDLEVDPEGQPKTVIPYAKEKRVDQ